MKRKKMIWIIAGFVSLCFLAAFAWFMILQNVEQPKYDIAEADGAIELRDYPALVAAEVVRQGNRRTAVSAGFRPLAGYIFAKERAGDKIAMTAPVTQSAADDETWTVRFIMPSQYTRESLPIPVSEDVKLVDLPAIRRAAIRFSGNADDASIAKNEATLRDWLSARGLTPAGPPTYAYYNDPFTPGFLRRNEVLFDLTN